MIDKLPPEVQQAIIGILGLMPTAMLARFLWHRRLVTLGRRKFWSIDLLWEIPTAMLSAVVGGGLASWWGMDSMASNAVVGVTAWLGPRGVEVMLGNIARRYFGREAKEE